MGIFSEAQKKREYVPRSNAGFSTLLGGWAQPESGQQGDLNRSPATTVDLYFSKVASADYNTGSHHGYIVVTDNATGKRWLSEAAPSTNWHRYPMGTVKAFTTSIPTGPQPTNEELALQGRLNADRDRRVASYSTDLSPEAVAEKLKAFSDGFTRRNIPYQLPRPALFLPGQDSLSLPPPLVQNSNYFAGASWEKLTGGLPSLPLSVSAPGWGDHQFDPTWTR